MEIMGSKSAEASAGSTAVGTYVWPIAEEVPVGSAKVEAPAGSTGVSVEVSPATGRRTTTSGEEEKVKV